MKYIRTKDGRIAKVEEHMMIKETTIDGVKKCFRLVYKDRPFICVLRGDEDYIIKQADTIDELCDAYVVDKFKHIFTIDEISKNIVRNCKESEIYGAIWIKGEHDEPILKSVVRMKGVLPNGEIDWVLTKEELIHEKEN